jgi:glucose-6-phosphate 1-dehydrogenase
MISQDIVIQLLVSSTKSMSSSRRDSKSDDRLLCAHLGQHERNEIIVLGASGDLAKKKTYPALFDLFANGFLTSNVRKHRLYCMNACDNIVSMRSYCAGI